MGIELVASAILPDGGPSVHGHWRGDSARQGESAGCGTNEERSCVFRFHPDSRLCGLKFPATHYRVLSFRSSQTLTPGKY